MDKELTDHNEVGSRDEASEPQAEQPVETTVDEQLIEEISIDGMCGVY